jgi:hypothetical protein
LRTKQPGAAAARVLRPTSSWASIAIRAGQAGVSCASTSPRRARTR